jgi:hypothetical protein
VKRTVVDLSLSFFMSHESSNGTIDPSLPKSSKESGETLSDSCEVSLCEEFQSTWIAIRKGDIQRTCFPKEHASPIML